MISSSYVRQSANMKNLQDEPWPKEIELYQPYEVEQILLPENASCLSTKTFLKMSNIPFRVCYCANAEFMSPGGRATKLPFVRVGAYVISEFEPIVNFVEHKDGISSLGNLIDDSEVTDMRTYISLVEMVLTCAELYVTYVCDDVYKAVTAPRNGSVFPWPLNIVQNHIKRNNAVRLLNVYSWHNMTLDDVVRDVYKCCENLVMKLEESGGPYFYGTEPSAIDACVFGHIFSILTTKLPNMALAETVQKFKPIVEFCLFIEKKYFGKSTL